MTRTYQQRAIEREREVFENWKMNILGNFGPQKMVNIVVVGIQIYFFFYFSSKKLFNDPYDDDDDDVWMLKDICLLSLWIDSFDFMFFCCCCCGWKKNLFKINKEKKIFK